MIGLSNAAVTGVISWSLFLIFCGWLVGIMTVLDDSEELTDEEWELIEARFRRAGPGSSPGSRSKHRCGDRADVIGRKATFGGGAMTSGGFAPKWRRKRGTRSRRLPQHPKRWARLIQRLRRAA